MSGFARAMWPQAVHDLAHAHSALAAQDFDWACVAARQGAEKALAIHDLNRLFDALVGGGYATPAEKAPLQHVPSTLVATWAVARYPISGLDTAPADLITPEQAGAAITGAQAILAFARSRGLVEYDA